MKQFTYIKIDKQNPVLLVNKHLRAIMVLRRKCHKIFDMIKCTKWASILDKSGFSQCKNLIIKECVMTIEQITNLEKTHKDLFALFVVLREHVETCDKCYYKGEKC
jgi:hypothetical protein